MNDIRTAFEKWAIDYAHQTNSLRVKIQTADAWIVWQAASSAVSNDWKSWPEDSPTINSRCEIWTQEGGNQFTNFGVGTKGKAPYFYWCGSPKKVLWRYVKPPAVRKE